MIRERQQRFQELLNCFVRNELTGWESMYELALAGDAHALCELANFVADYLEEDVRWLLDEATARGNLSAYYELGNYYYERAETEDELAQVFSYYKIAAKAGVADAMNNLADMYLNGEGTIVNEAAAYEWFLAAARHGVAEAKFTLGMMHEQGIGVAVDEAEAFFLYEQSANEGYEEAQYRMGMIYFEGLLHRQRNNEHAFTWFMKAAAHQQLDAIFNVAYCYEHGCGVEQNIQKAFSYYKQAALLGDYEAKRCLARLYEGIDLEQSKKWKRLANEQENTF